MIEKKSNLHTQGCEKKYFKQRCCLFFSFFFFSILLPILVALIHVLCLNIPVERLFLHSFEQLQVFNFVENFRINRKQNYIASNTNYCNLRRTINGIELYDLHVPYFLPQSVQSTRYRKYPKIFYKVKRKAETCIANASAVH